MPRYQHTLPTPHCLQPLPTPTTNTPLPTPHCQHPPTNTPLPTPLYQHTLPTLHCQQPTTNSPLPTPHYQYPATNTHYQHPIAYNHYQHPLPTPHSPHTPANIPLPTPHYQHPFTNTHYQHPTANNPLPTPHYQHPTTNTPLPTHTTNTPLPTPYYQHPTTNTHYQHPTANNHFQHTLPTPHCQHPTTNTPLPIPRYQHTLPTPLPTPYYQHTATNTHHQHPTANTLLPTPHYQYPATNTHYQHPTAYNHYQHPLPTPHCQHPTANIPLPTPHYQHPFTNTHYQHPTANNPLPTPHYQHPTTNTPLPTHTTNTLLPTPTTNTHCQHPTTNTLLPTHHCQQPLPTPTTNTPLPTPTTNTLLPTPTTNTHYQHSLPTPATDTHYQHPLPITHCQHPTANTHYEHPLRTPTTNTPLRTPTANNPLPTPTANTHYQHPTAKNHYQHPLPTPHCQQPLPTPTTNTHCQQPLPTPTTNTHYQHPLPTPHCQQPTANNPLPTTTTNTHYEHPTTNTPLPTTTTNTHYQHPTANNHYQHPLPTPTTNTPLQIPHYQHPLPTPTTNTHFQHPLPTPTTNTHYQHPLPTPHYQHHTTNTHYQHPLPTPTTNNPLPTTHYQHPLPTPTANTHCQHPLPTPTTNNPLPTPTTNNPLPTPTTNNPLPTPTTNTHSQHPLPTTHCQHPLPTPTSNTHYQHPTTNTYCQHPLPTPTTNTPLPTPHCQHPLPTPHYHALHSDSFNSTAQQSNDVLLLLLKWRRMNLELVLHPNEVTLPQTHSEWTRDNITYAKFPKRRCLYSGYVKGQSSSHAALSLCSGVSGYIQTDTELLFVQPKSKNSLMVGPSAHVLYTCEPKRRPSNLEMSTPDSHERHRRSTQKSKYLEVALVVDNDVVEKIGSKDKAFDYIMMLMGIVNTVYQHHSLGVDIKVVVSKMIFLAKSQEKEFVDKSCMTNTVHKFCDWSSKQMRPTDYDVSVLITESFAHGGIAIWRSLCRPTRSCAAVKEEGFITAFFIAHEIAHAHKSSPLPGTSCGHNKECHNDICTYVGIRKPVNGNWNSWTQWTSCSTDCGVGLKHRTRACNNPAPEFGGTPCEGETSEWDTCLNTKCENYEDGKQTDCDKWDHMQIRNGTHKWQAFEGQNDEVVTLDVLVENGTPCGYTKNISNICNICMNGKCITVGCDGKINSTLIDDQCGVCGGNGSQCKVISGHFSQKPRSGEEYMTVLTLPVNARHVKIINNKQSSHFLALQDPRYGTFYLNGDKRQSKDKKFVMNGAMFEYFRSTKNNETISTNGPVRRNIKVMVYSNKIMNETDIFYSFAIHKDVISYNIKKYAWKFDKWSDCSVTCGAGKHTMLHICYDKDNGQRVDDDKCLLFKAPRRDEVPCQRRLQCSAVPNHRFQWASSNWSKCYCESGSSKGFQWREIWCEQVKVSDNEEAIEKTDLTKCQDVTNKPEENMTCPLTSCIPQLRWKTGSDFGPCNAKCGETGEEKTIILCEFESKNGTVDMVDISRCEQIIKPTPASRSCTADPCEIEPKLFTWMPLDEWSDCDAACNQNGTHLRLYVCQEIITHNDHINVSSSQCDINTRPDERKECQGLPCTLKWQLGEWSECSVTCGIGKHYRKVFCGDPISDHDDNRCLETPPPMSKICNMKECPEQSDEDCVNKHSYCSVYKDLYTRCKRDNFKRKCCHVCLDYKRSANRRLSPSTTFN
ncbi:hypothetical protein Btru_008190 [Bulinus truncatus]|nr:hypothetical protein Btru_008190 [Bulinus truncatus]